MNPLTQSLELVLLVWVVVLLRRHGWRTERPRLVWTMTVGALVTNLLLYLVLLPTLKAQAVEQQLNTATLYGFLAFRTVEWAVFAQLLTRLALVLGRRYDLPGGFAYLRPRHRASRTVLFGVVTGIAAGGLGVALAQAWVAVGIVERPIWMEMLKAGFTWQAGFVGGVRNLFSEEVLMRLGVQTLLLYHLRRYRWAPLAAIALSSLFFEVWHSGGTDFFFINFAVSLVFAWSFNREGYETAAIGHCVADWLALALPLYLLASTVG